MKTAVVYNPSAGSGHGQAIAGAVEQSLGRRGFQVDLHPTQSPGDATAIASRLADHAGVIVAVGGDGTVNEVVNGMAAAGCTVAGTGPAEAAGAPATGADGRKRHGPLLGVVPAGTVNVFALELGIPFKVERACDVIAGGRTLSLDVGRANERRFTLMAGAGVDALTVRNIDLRAKRRFKELAFLGTGMKSGLSRQPPAFLVRTDGREYRATFFVAGNCHYYASRIRVTPAADPTDGLLDLLIFTGTTRAHLAVFWLGVPTGLHLNGSHVTYLRAERAELLPLADAETVWFQTDGELAGRLPATVEIDAHALEVLVP